MASISAWYHNQYSTWDRTRRIQASPFLARTDTRTSRVATAMARTATQDAVVINMGIVDDTTNKKEKDKKQESLFGPNIGVVNNVPQWAQSMGKQATADGLSSDIIKTWIAKSKEPSQPTTTLQALVNLKRPTLRLVPLAMAPGDDPERADSYHHHGLEFEYDCDAPKCRIIVNVILLADHPLVENVDSRGFSRTLVFETTVDGGFGKLLKLEEGATLELGQFEQPPQTERSPSCPEKAPADSPAEGTEAASNARSSRARKRFTAFNFRKRSTDRAASGPALAVVDAETAGPSADGEKVKGVKDDMREGVRVTIQLCALDEDGLDVATVNQQTTYLHIVRMGTIPTEDEDDTRPWVVQVIKREATIGPHTFHLHEIYGLSSQSAAPAQPQVAPPTTTDVHTYPPSSPAATAPVHEDEPSSECLLCLSSPREVILLPCRHLVACKECAINMVEFGAGGNIVHTEDSNASANAGTEGAGEGGANTNASATEGAAAPSVVHPNPRRKRKAKGWFCPVCRQPYTSLLRISTTPPTKDISDDDNRASTFIDEPDHEGGSDHEHVGNEGGNHNTTATTTATSDPLSATATNTHAPASTGMMNTLRSSFRRNIALSPPRNDGETLPRDVERGMEVPTMLV
ncbi:hypothetical protein BS17DRAFT_789183 [Gyrodon lividus]|nr:hypothetical protein BS17DRAFT_789183 [Gyrodon lividus]